MKFVLNIMYKLDYDWIWCFNYSVDVVLELKIYSLGAHNLPHDDL
jgi:hypothetical protein